VVSISALTQLADLVYFVAHTFLCVFYSSPLLPFPLSLGLQMNQQPQQQGEEEEDDTAPAMSGAMYNACWDGDVALIVELLNAGESIESVIGIGSTPILLTLYHGRLNASIELLARGG
jgi:hypothetical protein